MSCKFFIVLYGGFLQVNLYEYNQLLEPIINIGKGGSYSLFWEMIYNIRLLKYVRQSKLRLINDRYKVVGSKNQLKEISKLGLVKNTQEDIYIVLDNSLPPLKESGHNIKILPKEISGKGSINEINNTDVFIQALKLPDYLALLYPSWNYLRPDALLIRGAKERYKLEFLEIEAGKSNWNDYIENKRLNYLNLSKDGKVYSYWKAASSYLDLPLPNVKDFKFSVSIIGKIKKDFGKGFNFIEKLDIR